MRKVLAGSRTQTKQSAGMGTKVGRLHSLPHWEALPDPGTLAVSNQPSEDSESPEGVQQLLPFWKTLSDVFYQTQAASMEEGWCELLMPLTLGCSKTPAIYIFVRR